MSLYTTEVRYICETAAGRDISAGYNDLDEVLTPETIAKVMNFDYPIFDESYRNVLNKKILMHYYTREISEETVGLWKLRMRTKMNEIMPYYNKLYESETLEFNPLYDFDLTKTGNRVGNDNEIGNAENKNNLTDQYQRSKDGTQANTFFKDTNESNTDNEHMNGTQDANTVGASQSTAEANKDRLKKYSDTPQGDVQNLLDGTYLTNAETVGENEENKNNAQTQSNVHTETGTTTTKSGSVTGNEKGGENVAHADNEKYNREQANVENRKHNKVCNSTEDYLEQVKGKNSGTSYSKLLMEYRQSFINIDMMIIDELKLLFFGLWG